MLRPGTTLLRHRLPPLASYDRCFRALTCRAVAILLLASPPGDARAQSLLLPADAEAGDRFGSAVALEGGLALIGARGDHDAGPFSGSAYVFRRSGEAWVEEAELSAADPAEYDFFGISVALSEGRAFVGAVEGFETPGAVYVFREEGGDWVREVRLSPGAAEGRDDFGASVAAEGDLVLVGAPESDGGRGAAYVFRRDGATWVEEARLTALELSADARFGSAVALSGGRALIGAPFEGEINEGVMYLFERGEEGWQPSEPLFPTWPTTKPHRAFGSAVALGSDTAVGGAPVPDGESVGGSALVFRREGAVWFAERELESSAGIFDDEFGDAVASGEVAGMGEVVLVGARFRDADDGTAGNAFLFVQEEGEWTERARLVSPNPEGGTNFGEAVAVSGAALLVGAPGDSDGRGAAYVYDVAALVPAAAAPRAALPALPAPYPNPAGRGGFSFTLTLPEAQRVLVDVVDLQGRRIQRAFSGALPAGDHPFHLFSTGLSSGVYVIRATGATFSAVQRVVVLGFR